MPTIIEKKTSLIVQCKYEQLTVFSNKAGSGEQSGRGERKRGKKTRRKAEKRLKETQRDKTIKYNTV